MGGPNFNDEFKRDVVTQIDERGYTVTEVTQRLGHQPAFVVCLQAAVRENGVG